MSFCRNYSVYFPVIAGLTMIYVIAASEPLLSGLDILGRV